MDSKNTQRYYLGVFFFLVGILFSSWASRIPTIKSQFNFNDAELGTLLFAMPVASMIGLPISGFLVSRFDSRVPLAFSFAGLSISLTLISLAVNPLTLTAAICLFSFSMRIVNIAINTQAITLQKLFDRNINGTFHGLWSTGGIAGVGISTLMLSMDISMSVHFLVVTVLTLLAAFLSFKHLLKNDRASSGNKLIIGKPDPYIFFLGIIVFFSAICEGGMFDWSGIYFREVVGEEIFTAGYLIFMTFMALSRFVSDRIVEKIGMPRTYILSGSAIMTGILMAIIFPYFWPSLIGFSLVGFGTASIIPMTFTLAGLSKKYSSGMAISIVTTYVIAGMLSGPPMIGYLAHAFGLKNAFIAFAIAGFLLIPVPQLFFRYKKSLERETAV